MLTRRTVLVAGPIALVAAPAATLTACSRPVRWSGVDVATGDEIALIAGPMPDGATFTGTYQSAQTNRLVLTQTDSRITGTYGEPAGPPKGTLDGSVTGNAATFAWREVDGGVSVEGTGFFILDPWSARGVRLFGTRTFRRTCESSPWTATRRA